MKGVVKAYCPGFRAPYNIYVRIEDKLYVVGKDFGSLTEPVPDYMLASAVSNDGLVPVDIPVEADTAEDFMEKAFDAVANVMDSADEED